jgi:hypothetical protein
MANPTIRHPKLVDGVFFPVRWVPDWNCFEDARGIHISAQLVGQIATRLAGTKSRSFHAGEQVIRVLLFLRAWHAELRLWRHGVRHMLRMEGSLNDEQLHQMSMVVNRYWVDFSCGYIRIR